MISFFLPGGIIFLILAAIIKFGYIGSFPPNIPEIYPFIVIASSLLIGFVFKRSRLIYSVVLIFLAGFVLYKNLLNIDMNLFILSFIFPINLFLIYNFSEKGIIKLSFVKYSLLFLIQVSVYIYVKGYKKVFAENVMSMDIIGNYVFEGIILTKISLIIYISVLIFLLAEYLLKKDFSAKGFFWALLTTSLIFYSGFDMGLKIFCLSTAGLILLVNFVMSSYDVAYKDKLTELPSRRSFDEAVLGLGNKYSIGLIDIDFFKKFNDKYGHDVGDQVLKMVGARLLKIKGGGKPFRYGGEEFAVLFGGRNQDESIEYLEDLRKDIEYQKFKIRGRKRPKKKPKLPVFFSRSKEEKLTVSIGVAEKNDKLHNVQDVIKAADIALYKAKKEGRNRICYN